MTDSSQAYLHLYYSNVLLKTPPLGTELINSRKDMEMKWATRKNMKCDRIASAWLIRRYIDPHANISYVEDGEIAKLTEKGILTFDASDAKYRHQEDTITGKYGDRCTFQILMDEYNVSYLNPAMKYFGNIVYAADIGHRIGIFEPKEGYGFWALMNGFAILMPDDNEKERYGFAVCDALYQYCKSIL